MRLTTLVLFAALPVIGQNPPAPNVDASRAAQKSSQAEAHTPRMRESQAAMQIIDSTKEARAALSRKDAKAALDSVNHALSASRDLDKLGDKKGKIPVYSEVVRVSVYAPSKVVGAGNAASTTPKSADSGSADRARPVQEVAGEYTNIFLDTTGLTQHLDQARSALERGDAKAADQALAMVESAVTSDAVGTDLPLVRARENLIIASQQVRAGQYAAAQVTLGVAVQALEDYANTVGAAHGPEARALGRQIVLYAQRLQTDHDNAVGQIENWWDHIASFSEPTVSNNKR